MVSGSPWRYRLPLIAVLLAATALRFWRLPEIPPGFQFDEAYNAIDAREVLRGNRDVFFPDNGGREPLLAYIQAPFLAILGDEHAALALRLTSAFIGILSVAATFAAIAALAGRRTGVIAAAFLAGTYWHVHFSRYGIRAVLAPLWTALALRAWWKVVQASAAGTPADLAAGSQTARSTRGSAPPVRAQGRHRLRAVLRPATLCGAALAGAVYSHPSGRLLPVVIGLHALAAIASTARRPGVRSGGNGARHAWREALTAGSPPGPPRAVPAVHVSALLAGVGVAGGVAAVLFLPLGAYFLRHPHAFTAHAADVSLSAVAARDFDGQLLAALADHAARIAGMFFVAGDPSTFHNLPGLPVFDPVTALLAVVGAGVVVAAAGIAGEPRDPGSRFGLGTAVGQIRGAAWLLCLWLAVMLVPTLVSDRPPQLLARDRGPAGDRDRPRARAAMVDAPAAERC